MRPDLVAELIRRVAAEIDSSRNPSRIKTARSLRSILLHLSNEEGTNPWEGTDVDKVKKKIDEYIKLMKATKPAARMPTLTRDWEEVRGLVQSPGMIQRSNKWRDWSPEALRMLERSLDHLIANFDAYMEYPEE